MEELCAGEVGLQAAGINRHPGGRIEDRARAEEQEHTDEEVVDDADVEEHLRWHARTAQKPHARVPDAHMMLARVSAAPRKSLTPEALSP